jgi:hypothetical protein
MSALYFPEDTIQPTKMPKDIKQLDDARDNKMHSAFGKNKCCRRINSLDESQTTGTGERWRCAGRAIGGTKKRGDVRKIFSTTRLFSNQALPRVIVCA